MMKIFSIILGALFLTGCAAMQAPQKTVMLNVSDSKGLYAAEIVSFDMKVGAAQIKVYEDKLMQRIADEKDPKKQEILQKMFGEGLFSEDDYQFLADRFLTYYKENFTEEELKTIAEFYRHSVALKLITNQEKLKPLLLELIGRKFQKLGQTLQNK